MALATSNRQGGTTSERGFQSAQGAALVGDVISGFRVRQAETLGMLVRIGGEYDQSTTDQWGRLIVDLSDNAIIRDGLKYHTVFTDDGAAVTANVATAHASLPRKDLVVVYIDRTITRAKTPVDNANGVVKVMAVAGTPASSPNDPTVTAIQDAIGIGNPYIILARINVPNAATTIVQSMIDDLRLLAGPVMPVGFITTDTLAESAVTESKLTTQTNRQILAGTSGSYTLGDGADSFINFKAVVPNDYVEGTAMTFKYIVNSSGVGTLNQQFNVFRVRDGEQAFAFTVPNNDVNVTEAFKRYEVTPHTTGNDDFLRGDILYFRVTRDTADSNTGIADYDCVWVEYTGRA